MTLEIAAEFKSEAESLTRIIALSYDPGRKLTDPPEEGVVRLLGEALQSAYEAGLQKRARAALEKVAP